MSYVVAKDFNSIQRRFKAGASVNDGDDVSPHTIESLKAGGFIKDEAAASAQVESPGKRAAPSPFAPSAQE